MADIIQQNGNHSITVKFPLSLSDLKGELRDMTPYQRRRQISRPFAVNGIYFVVAIEKLNENEHAMLGGIDVSVGIFCISVPVDPDYRGDFPLIDRIRSEQNIFHATTGEAFNLLGQPRPAHAVEFFGELELTLDSGKTVESTEMNLLCENDSFGGHFHGQCYGFWATILKNHHCNDGDDGKHIVVTVDFHGDLPIALFREN